MGTGLTCPATKNNDGTDKMDGQYLVLAVCGPSAPSSGSAL